MTGLEISYGESLSEARFVERPNRFLVVAEMSHGTVEAHLPDPGRLRELLLPGKRIWLRPAEGSKRRTRWTVALTETDDGSHLVSLDSILPNRLIRMALEEQVLEEFSGWNLLRPEVSVGHHRFDFLLGQGEDRRLLLEVKSVTLVENDVALFPDAITDRGRRHMESLADLVSRGSYEAVVLFVAQRGDVRVVEAAAHIDPAFSQALIEARQAGVRILARRCRVTLDGLILDAAIPVV